MTLLLDIKCSFEALKNMQENYIQDLNPEQEKAVKHIDGPSMVIAGAGSGKTRVLTYKIVYLLQNNIKPSSILALTFTNKASKEMQKRIEEIVGFNYSNNLWMGTFHSVFSRILRFEANHLNYSSNFTIYDTEDSKSLIRSIIKELNLDKEIYKVNFIRNRISSMKNNFITAKEYNNNKELIEADKIAKRIEFGRIYNIYNNRCMKADAMDFDDLLIKTYELLSRNKDTLLKYQEKFKYILIDEYQDTNNIQYLIIKQIAALYKNICVVGDDAQSIYSFRGANIQNILNFKLDYPEHKIYKLEQNYRSTSTIVEAANSIIKHNKKQIKKKVWTNNIQGEKIIIAKTGSDNEESRIVAKTINDIQLQNEAKYEEFAILYRTNAQSRALEEALRKRNIAYKIYGGLSFYQRKEIKDLLSYYRLTINQKDEEALKRIINYPARGIGLTTIQKLTIAANKMNISIWEVINNIEEIGLAINNGTKNKLENFVLLINTFKEEIEIEDAYTIAEKIAKNSGILSELYNDKTNEGINRFENIQELLNGIKTFTDSSEQNNTLPEFMKEVALLTNEDKEDQKTHNKVTLMTIHSAKGLEFPYVFIVGLEENLFPSLMSKESEESMEEERRLFYVAITRAKKRVFITFAASRFKWGQIIDCSPSRFIREIDSNCLEKKEMYSKETRKPVYSVYLKTRDRRDKKKQSVYQKKLRKINNNTINSRIDLTKITNGIKVKHNQFGTGTVINIQGEGINKKATVFFAGVGQKNLLLRFAKLELIEK